LHNRLVIRSPYPSPIQSKPSYLPRFRVQIQFQAKRRLREGIFLLTLEGPKDIKDGIGDFLNCKCLSKSKILKMLQIIDVEEKVTHS
jgi:hypothetical protein